MDTIRTTSRMSRVKRITKTKQMSKLKTSYIFTNRLRLFSIRYFFCRHWQLTQQHGKGGEHLYCSLAFPLAHKHLFTTLHVRWLPHIFNQITYNYQTAAPWDLPPLEISFWRIVTGMLISAKLIMIWLCTPCLACKLTITKCAS